MKASDIVAGGVYRTTGIGRYGVGERIVAKIEAARTGPKVFYQVRRDGVTNPTIYTCALDFFVRNVVSRV